VLGVVGEGAMSVVYRARDTVLERDVALKALHPSLLGDEGIKRRFRREARLARGWTHPNIATVHDVLDVGGVLAIVMELVAGMTLRDLIASWGGPLPFPEIRAVADGVLAAVAAAHARGVVHRDL
jgi:serine/threonine-protein kinase